MGSWNGNFGSRRKREVGDSETEEEASNVPSVMESGSSALGWLKAAVRKTRSAEPEKENKKPKKKEERGQKKATGGQNRRDMDAPKKEETEIIRKKEERRIGKEEKVGKLEERKRGK